MNDLSFSELYTSLMLNAIGKHTDYSACQYSAGVVLGGFYELQEQDVIDISKNGRISIRKKLGADCPRLSNLYHNIETQSAKTLSKWLDYYCLSATSKNVRPVIDDVIFSLSEKGVLYAEVKRGILRSKTQVRILDMQPIVNSFKASVMNGDMEDSVIFTVQMLQLADVLKRYFSMSERFALKKTIGQYKRSSIWKQMEPCVNTIQNFNYQNTVYTGASE